MTDKKQSGVEIRVAIHGLKSKTIWEPEIKAHVTTFTVESLIGLVDLARILNLQAQGVLLVMAISSPQAQMDLRLDTVDAATGEIVSEAERIASGK